MPYLASLIDVARLCLLINGTLLALLPVAFLVAFIYIYRKLEPADRMIFFTPLKYGFRAGADWFFEPETGWTTSTKVGLDYDRYTWDWPTRTLTLHNLRLPSEGYVAQQFQLTISWKVCSLTIHHFAMPNPPPPPGLEKWKNSDLLHIGHCHLDFGGLVGLLSNCMPLYESADDCWAMGPVMSRVSQLSISVRTT